MGSLQGSSQPPPATLAPSPLRARWRTSGGSGRWTSCAALTTHACRQPARALEHTGRCDPTASSTRTGSLWGLGRSATGRTSCRHARSPTRKTSPSGAPTWPAIPTIPAPRSPNHAKSRSAGCSCCAPTARTALCWGCWPRPSPSPRPATGLPSCRHAGSATSSTRASGTLSWAARLAIPARRLSRPVRRRWRSCWCGAPTMRMASYWGPAGSWTGSRRMERSATGRRLARRAALTSGCQPSGTWACCATLPASAPRQLPPARASQRHWRAPACAKSTLRCPLSVRAPRNTWRKCP
mmetsp:Transcript_41409/g.107234  ORF Transcript_41409/g.107234 Transcript_41409/m.107234 type:complete len:296 (-) Transcript_41409:1791-2678(-)